MKTAIDHAEEIAECIESCDLKGRELELYVACMVCEIASLSAEELESLKNERSKLESLYEKELKKNTPPPPLGGPAFGGA